MKKIRTLIIPILVIVFILTGTISTSAYFDRGTVGVSLGASSVSIEAGSGQSVSVSFSPSSSDQLPGCGMAECPQICGEKNCLDENGECMCNGTDYQTYYAFASVSSSNTSVASASYSNGVVYISGVSAGTATITVTASLRQFNSSSAKISVTVYEKQTEARTTQPETTARQQETTAKKQTETTTSKQNETTTKKQAETTAKQQETTTSGSGVSVKPVNENETQKNSETATEPEGQTAADGETGEAAEVLSAYQSIDSDRGMIYFVPDLTAKTVGEVTEALAGQDAFVDFQSKDQADTVLYAWEFYGKNIKKAASTDLSLEISQNAFSGFKQDADKCVFIAFNDNSVLPAEGSLYIRVSEYMANDTEVNLYELKDNCEIVILDEDIAVENGYVTLNLDHRASMFISTEKYENAETETAAETVEETTAGAMDGNMSGASESQTDSSSGFSVWLIVVIAAAVCAGAAAAVIIIRKKRK